MSKPEKMTVIADFSAVPLGQETASIGRYVAEAVNAIGQVKGVKYKVTAMGTILEAEKLDLIFEAVKAAHEALFKIGVKRIVSNLGIDDRRDKPRTMEDKLKTVKHYMAKAKK